MTKKMKNTGVEWIGEVPESWEILKISSIYIQRNEKVSDVDYKPLSVTKNGVVLQLENVAKTNNGDNRKLVKRGDFVINSRSDRRGSCGISLYDGSVSLINTVLEPHAEINSEYYNYVFKSERFSDEFYKWGHGIVDDLWSTKWSDMKNIHIPYTDIKEQERISNYLNMQISKIDSVINKTKETIDEYKKYKKSFITELVTKGLDENVEMKDSGVEWIGEMPKHWDIKKGKYILNLISRDVKDDDEVITCFRDGEVTLRKNRREDGFTFAEKESGYQGIEPNDLVIHGMDGFAGAIGISDSRGKSSPVLVVCDSNQNKEFIMYYLRSMAYNDIFMALATGIRVRSCDLRWNKISNLPYPIPSIKEQEDIVKKINKKCMSIDGVINSKEQLIKELEYYKKSLIYECVTGKKEV